MNAMKRVKYTIGFLVVSFAILLTSCEDEIVRESTHTDASSKVVGNYSGTLTFDTTSYDDVTIVLSKIENDSVQAILLNIQSSEFDFTGATGMNLSTNVNVAHANNSYLFSSGFSSTLRLSGRLTNTDLTIKLPIQVRSSNKEVRFHTNGNDWLFVGTKN